MPLTFNQTGPYALQGQVFSAFLGTAIAFSAGLAVAYAGLGIANPVGSGAKVTILRAAFAPTATGPATMSPWGLAKLLGPINGTTSMGTLSAFSGIVVCAGAAGTAQVQGTSLGKIGTGQGTSVCQLFGTATVLNGTAGPSVLGLNWTEVMGCHGTNLIGPVEADATGATVLYPGETAVIVSAVAVTSLAGLEWLEGSL
jgi:hypothetical protein